MVSKSELLAFIAKRRFIIEGSQECDKIYYIKNPMSPMGGEQLCNKISDAYIFSKKDIYLHDYYKDREGEYVQKENNSGIDKYEQTRLYLEFQNKK